MLLGVRLNFSVWLVKESNIVKEEASYGTMLKIDGMLYQAEQ